MNENPNKLINNIQKLAGSYSISSPSNTPTQYKDRQHEYLNRRNKKFSQSRAYLSNDYVLADVQGLNTDDFYAWESRYIRFSDMAQTSSMTTRKTDDWKNVMFPDEDIDYFPSGAKIEAMGSTWLCVNPSNMASAYATAVVVRCNSAYNSYDYYGNIITEPIYVGTESINKTAPFVESYHINLMDGNVLITCQYNENTKRLGETKRLILGSKIYYITGYADYIQEFTGDRNSTHTITFTARVEEPTELDDMLETFVAGGKAESYSAVMNIPDMLKSGSGSTVINALFIHNEEEVASTETYPLTWIFESSDESVVTANAISGTTDRAMIIPVAAGTATIRATLKENPNIRINKEITVINGELAPYIEFSEYKDTTITQFTSESYKAVYHAGTGLRAIVNIDWTLTGADYDSDYSYEISEDTSTITITCIHASTTPLLVTASHGGASETITITLEGY